MRRFVRWNLSSRARQLTGGDAIVVSIPKSGRTWVRTFLCAYFCEKIGQPFTLEPEKYESVPQVIYTHDLFEQRTKADRWDKLRGKYLIPQRDRTGRPIILLARDPRDAFVSLYIQLTRRTRETPGELKQMSASELLRDPAFGIQSMSSMTVIRPIISSAPISRLIMERNRQSTSTSITATRTTTNPISIRRIRSIRREHSTVRRGTMPRSERAQRILLTNSTDGIMPESSLTRWARFF